MENGSWYAEFEIKYGEDFCWMRVNPEKTRFVSEAYREIEKDHPLYGQKLIAFAKCEANDDVLFLTELGQFVIIHLTYSKINKSGYPQYCLFNSQQELEEYLEKEIQTNR